MYIGIVEKFAKDVIPSIEEVNGAPAIVGWRDGVIDSKLSAVDCLMLVSFFSLVMFTSMSSEREFSPTTMPS